MQRRRASRAARCMQRTRRQTQIRARSCPSRPRATTCSIVFRTAFEQARDGDARRSTLEREADGKWRVIGYVDPVTARARRRSRPRTVARSRSSPAPRAAARRTGIPAKQKLVCPFCGTESPAQARTRDGQIVEHDLVAALRGIADERARLEGRRSARSSCQSCNAISVFDPDAAGAELRVLRLGAARAVRGDQARVPPRERAAVRDQRSRGARPHPRSGTASCGSRRTRSSGAR